MQSEVTTVRQYLAELPVDRRAAIEAVCAVIRRNFLVLYRSIFDLVRDFMKDEAFNQQDQTLRRY